MVRSPAANRVVRETGPAGSSPAPSAKNFLEKVSWGLMRPHNIRMERLRGLCPGLAGRLGCSPPMRRLPRHAGQLGAPYMAGMASGYASRSRKPVILARGSEGSTPSPVASRAQPRHLFLLSLYTRAGQSRSGHTAASSIGRAPGSDPGEVGSIPAAAASRAMRRGFFSLLSLAGWGPGSSHLGLPCPVRDKPAAKARHLSATPFLRISLGVVVRPSARAHTQQCDNGSRPAWNAGAPNGVAGSSPACCATRLVRLQLVSARAGATGAQFDSACMCPGQ